jgi:hypothetical protein
VDSQNVELHELKEDIREIKVTIKELAMATTTLALHSQRLDNMESRLSKSEREVEDAWDEINAIRTTCALREPVFRFGAERMGSPALSHNEWLNMFLGSALRNGIWIVATGLLMAWLTGKVR